MNSKKLEKILFLGLGGAGQRHLRLFKDQLSSAEFIAYRHTGKTSLLTPDFKLDNSTTLEKKYLINTVKNIEAAILEKPDLVIISTPTSTHSSFCNLFAREKINIFIEKPGITNFKEAILIHDSILKNQIGFNCGFQRQYHPLIKYIKNILNNETLGEIVNIKINVSSFMPNWHIYEDYKNLYASNKKLGGGIINTECHEIYFVIDLFGIPDFITGYQVNKEFYELDINHSCNLQFHYKKFIVEINLSFIHKRTQRSIVINGTKNWFCCDLDKNIYESSIKDNSILNFDKYNNPIQIFRDQTKYIIDNFNKVNKTSLRNLLNLGKAFDEINKLKVYS